MILTDLTDLTEKPDNWPRARARVGDDTEKSVRSVRSVRNWLFGSFLDSHVYGGARRMSFAFLKEIQCLNIILKLEVET